MGKIIVLPILLIMLTSCDGSSNHKGAADVSVESGAGTSYNPCDHRNGSGSQLSYSISLPDGKLHLKNLNYCDSIYIWARLTQNYAGYYDGLIVLDQILEPNESLGFDLDDPSTPSFRDDFIFSAENGDTYILYLPYGTLSYADRQPVLMLDFDDYHVSSISGYDDIFSFRDGEVRTGRCHNFDWIDKFKGHYQINSDPLKEYSYCQIGNISGYKSDGTFTWLDGLRYFVADKSKLTSGTHK